MQRQAGYRSSRQDEPLGTVPAHAERAFSGGHPYVSETATLAVTTQDGRTLDEASLANSAGFSTETDGRTTRAMWRVGSVDGR